MAYEAIDVLWICQCSIIPLKASEELTISHTSKEWRCSYKVIVHVGGNNEYWKQIAFPLEVCFCLPRQFGIYYCVLQFTIPSKHFQTLESF